MKRFTKMLALGMAVALTLGMTVSASENDAANPSVGVAVADRSEGVNVLPVDNVEEVVEACRRAVEDDGVFNGVFGTSMETFQLLEVMDVVVTKPGTVTLTINPRYLDGVYEGRAKDYGYAWGYALLHFKNGDLNSKPEIIKMTKDGNRYTANVNSGSPYGVIFWKLRYSASGAGHGLSMNQGLARSTYQDEHTAARVAIENDGWGTVSAQYYNSQYVFAKTMGSAVVGLAEDTKVQFNGLDNLEQGEAYVVLCYNDVQDISGAPDRHFLMTDKDNKVADGAYTVTLPKGEYAVVVVKVTTDVTKVPADPVAAPEATAPDLSTGTGTAGVVSPKTGEMLPFAVILAAICLAGAAVCAKKARTNA